MKKIILLLAISLVTFTNVKAQKLKGNKNVTIENREIDYFNSIKVSGKLNINIQESPENKIIIETDENLHEAIETRVTDEVLEIFLSKEIKSKKALNITVGVTESLLRIEASDRVKITCENDIHTEITEVVASDYASVQLKLRSDFITITGTEKSKLDLNISAKERIKITLSSKSSLELQTSTKSIVADLSDNTTIKASGICTELDISSTDNANIKGKNLLLEDVIIKTSGKTNHILNVSGNIIIDSNNSTINLYGSPRIAIEKFNGKSVLRKK